MIRWILFDKKTKMYWKEVIDWNTYDGDDWTPHTDEARLFNTREEAKESKNKGEKIIKVEVVKIVTIV